MSEFIRRAGIVKGVQARKHKQEFVNMRVDLEFKTEERVAGYVYDDADKQIDDMIVTLPIGTPVNPGDAVVITMEFVSPLGQRFKPALEVGTQDTLDEDWVADDEETETQDDVSEFAAEVAAQITQEQLINGNPADELDEDDPSNGGHSFNGIAEDAIDVDA